MEYYRRYILPDLVRYYRGIYARRQIDPNAAFGDLVFAQQNLTTNVNTYIGILGSLWTSVVGVADFLQTDDMFQMAKPHAMPELPDFRQLIAAALGLRPRHPVAGPGSSRHRRADRPGRRWLPVRSLPPRPAGRRGVAPSPRQP